MSFDIFHFYIFFRKRIAFLFKEKTFRVVTRIKVAVDSIRIIIFIDICKKIYSTYINGYERSVRFIYIFIL